MNREAHLERVRDPSEHWDLVVIGGGATGLGVALDAAARGLKTALLERHDFGKGTSSRSTKLIHGGLRYLRQGRLSLVRESLRERTLLLRNAPDLVRPLSLVIPAYKWWERSYYGLGLKLYDLLARDSGLPRSRFLSNTQTIEALPTIQRSRLHGGVRYFDGQFDDARFLVALAERSVELGAALLNYASVDGLLREGGRIGGVEVTDREGGGSFEVRARVVVNATGVFADEVRRLDDARSAATISRSRGTHIVLKRECLPGSSALMIPSTDDGRVLFAIPWHDRVLLGTTDEPVEEASDDPAPSAEEIGFLLTHAARYLEPSPSENDVTAAFAGLRPLLGFDRSARTGAISRSHHVSVSESGLVSITGGKWTTYRKMAEDAVDTSMEVAGLDHRPSLTRHLRLTGGLERDLLDEVSLEDDAGDPGTEEVREGTRREKNPLLHPGLPYRWSDVDRAIRCEMARTVEDVLARRTRSLFLDAGASAEIAPEIAAYMARALGREDAWAEEQVRAFSRIASGYVMGTR